MGKVILIVDDSPIIRSIIKKTLHLADIDISHVHESSQGENALEILEENAVDLMFVDINMPVMNGEELIESVKRRGLLEDMSVIVVSTEGSKPRVDKLKSKGVNAYVRKPFTPEILRNTVGTVIKE